MHRLLLASSVLFASGCLELPASVDSPETEVVEELALAPLYSIRLHAIATADDDGSNASPVRASTITAMLPELNAIFDTTRIEILFDPATDFEQRDSTVLNQRFAVLGDPADYTDPQVPPPTSDDWHDTARRYEADQHRDKLTVFFASPNELVYDDGAGHWIEKLQGGGGAGSRNGRSIAWRRSVTAPDLAHEMGHYLHNTHPHVGYDSIEHAAAEIAEYLDAGNPVADGLKVLDGDDYLVLDTPPDGAGTIFAIANDPDPNDEVIDASDKCGPIGSVQIPVTYGNNQHHTYTLEPDRTLVMSYFKGCPFDMRFSVDQRARILEAGTLMNRRNVFKFASEPPTSSTPILAYQDTDSAGPVREVEIARVGVHRVVTAATDVDTLKLIVWDVGTGSIDGDLLRRGEIVVGEIGSEHAGSLRSFAITHGGLRQVVVAYRAVGGGLTLKSYAIDTSGNLTLQHTTTDDKIAQVEIARIDPVTFVTPVRLASGVLRVIAWRVHADGTFHRVAHDDGIAIDAIEGVTSYTPASKTGEKIGGAATLFLKSANGNLIVQTWEVYEGGPVVMAASEAAGAIGSSTASSLDFDLAASVVQTASGTQKVILWKSGYFGGITRRGSYTAGECSKTASAAIGTRYLSTACRQPGGAMIVRLYEVSPDGLTVELKHEQESGTVNDLAMAEVGSNKVVIAMRGLGNRMVVKTFAVAP